MKYLLLLFLVALFACEGEDYSIEEDVVYFQYEYANEAWGHQQNGFIVDMQGNIYEYDKPENWTHTEKNQISLEDFQSNLSQTETSSKTVDVDELNRMLNLASSAENGELTERKFVMADAGGESYTIYIGEKDSNKLTNYLLQVRGDIYQKNTSSAADEITDWLIGIRGEEGFSEEGFND